MFFFTLLRSKRGNVAEQTSHSSLIFTIQETQLRGRENYWKPNASDKDGNHFVSDMCRDVKSQIKLILHSNGII